MWALPSSAIAWTNARSRTHVHAAARDAHTRRERRESTCTRMAERRVRGYTVSCTSEAAAGVAKHATAARTPDAPLHVRTPLLYSNPLSEVLGYDVWLKMDALQPSGTSRVG